MAKTKPTLQEPRPWERQKGETEGAWEAFLAFRDIEGKRTVNKVSEKLSKSRQQITKWKKLWYWDERVRAYDNSLQAEAFEAAVKELAEMQKRHLAISSHLQRVAIDALNNKNVNDFTTRDIKEYLRIATELERQTRISMMAPYKAEALRNRDNNDPALAVNMNDEDGNSDVIIYLPEIEDEKSLEVEEESEGEESAP